jgi:DNA replication protein DnaC
MSAMTMTVAPELASALRRLRLGRVLATLGERILLAEKQGMRFEELLMMILTDEIARRDGSAAERRAVEARLDPDMTLERFDPAAKITYDKRLFAELTSGRFIEARRHVVVLGPVGVGKTFLSSALGHIACRHGYSVLFTRADAMLHSLKKSRFDNTRDDEMLALTTVDLLIVDDFALEPMSRDESKDVYELFVERTGRASTIITSNRDTSEWIAMFDDVLRAQSAVDRFKNAAYDLVIEGESYRSRLKPKLEEASGAAERAMTRETTAPRRKRRR